MFKHILVPTDDSTLSRKAVKAGITLAKSLGAKVTAYHALQVGLPYGFRDGVIIKQQALHKTFEEEARKRAEKFLGDAAKAAAAAGVVCATYVDKPATPYEGITALARKNKCDVIVIASHGRDAFSSLLLGSVTQKVLASSKIPVLVYR